MSLQKKLFSPYWVIVVLKFWRLINSNLKTWIKITRSINTKIGVYLWRNASRIWSRRWRLKKRSGLWSSVPPEWRAINRFRLMLQKLKSQAVSMRKTWFKQRICLRGNHCQIQICRQPAQQKQFWPITYVISFFGQIPKQKLLQNGRTIFRLCPKVHDWGFLASWLPIRETMWLSTIRLGWVSGQPHFRSGPENWGLPPCAI